jgi:hypothetical protein
MKPWQLGGVVVMNGTVIVINGIHYGAWLAVVMTLIAMSSALMGVTIGEWYAGDSA